MDARERDLQHARKWNIPPVLAQQGLSPYMIAKIAVSVDNLDVARDQVAKYAREDIRSILDAITTSKQAGSSLEQVENIFYDILDQRMAFRDVHRIHDTEKWSRLADTPYRAYMDISKMTDDAMPQSIKNEIMRIRTSYMQKQHDVDKQRQTALKRLAMEQRRHRSSPEKLEVAQAEYRQRISENKQQYFDNDAEYIKKYNEATDPWVGHHFRHIYPDQDACGKAMADSGALESGGMKSLHRFLDQRLMKDAANQWDRCKQERTRWSFLHNRAQAGNGPLAFRHTIMEINNQRNILDDMGIPNYVLVTYEADWQTIREVTLEQFPHEGKGPVCVDRGDGISYRVQEWLRTIQYFDQAALREYLHKKRGWGAVETTVFKPRSGTYPIKPNVVPASSLKRRRSDLPDDEGEVTDIDEELAPILKRLKPNQSSLELTSGASKQVPQPMNPPTPKKPGEASQTITPPGSASPPKRQAGQPIKADQLITPSASASKLNRQASQPIESGLFIDPSILTRPLDRQVDQPIEADRFIIPSLRENLLKRRASQSFEGSRTITPSTSVSPPKRQAVQHAGGDKPEGRAKKPAEDSTAQIRGEDVVFYSAESEVQTVQTKEAHVFGADVDNGSVVPTSNNSNKKSASEKTSKELPPKKANKKSLGHEDKDKSEDEDDDENEPMDFTPTLANIFRDKVPTPGEPILSRVWSAQDIARYKATAKAVFKSSPGQATQWNLAYGIYREQARRIYDENAVPLNVLNAVQEQYQSEFESQMDWAAEEVAMN